MKCFRIQYRILCIICLKWDYFSYLWDAFTLQHYFLCWVIDFSSKPLLACTVVGIFSLWEVYSFWNDKMINVCKILIVIVFFLPLSPPHPVFIFLLLYVTKQGVVQRRHCLVPTTWAWFSSCEDTHLCRCKAVFGLRLQRSVATECSSLPGIQEMVCKALGDYQRWMNLWFRL